MMKLTFATSSVLLASASAHTIFQELYVNGVAQGHTTGIRVPTYDGPVQDVTSNDIICNGGVNPLRTPLPTDIINVKAGDNLTAEWHHTLDSTPATDSQDPIDPSHLGPVMVYLAKVDSALTTTVTGLEWFKIYEDGLDSSLQWAVTRLYNNKGKVNFVLPSCIPAGQYLLRAEIIALHAASSYPGAQFYMECAQINVQSSSAKRDAEDSALALAPRRHLATRAGFSPNYVSFPGAYKGSDPGVTFNLYWPKPTNYTIPGPRPLVC